MIIVISIVYTSVTIFRFMLSGRKKTTMELKDLYDLQESQTSENLVKKFEGYFFEEDNLYKK